MWAIALNAPTVQPTGRGPAERLAIARRVTARVPADRRGPPVVWRIEAARARAISGPRPVAPGQGGSRAGDSEPHFAVAAGDFAEAVAADSGAAAVEAFEVAEDVAAVDAGRTSTSSTRWFSSADWTTVSVTIASPTLAATRPMSG